MRPKVSISQLLEVTAIVGITLALDQVLLLFHIPGLTPILLLVIVCGTLTGVYMGFRWSKRRDVLSIMAGAGVSAVCATLVNSLRTAISIAESLRRATDGAYFSWDDDWPLFIGLVIGTTMIATVLATVLSLVPIMCERILRPLKQ